MAPRTVAPGSWNAPAGGQWLASHQWASHDQFWYPGRAGWLQPQPSWWPPTRQFSEAPPQFSDDPTVEALAELLSEWGGCRPASAVGFLYGQAGGLHKKAIQACGGVSGFVRAHADVFVLEPPGPGESCASIRLLSEEERAAAQAAASKARKVPVLCKFFQSGGCLKGDACRFSHDLEPGPPSSPSRRVRPPDCEAMEGESRLDAIRAQISYYLSDDNFKTDCFFQGVIATTDGGWIPLAVVSRCNRIQQLGATVHEILDAVRDEPWAEVHGEPGMEAMRRICPPPPLEDVGSLSALAPPEMLEPTLQELPLTLLSSRSSGWKAVVDDAARRSFCFLRRNTWPAEGLQQEFELLQSNTRWTKLRNKKEGIVTRSTAWYVLPGCRCRYSYGDTVMEPMEKPEWLAGIEERVLGEGCGLSPEERPNCVNMNLYEDQGQNVGWHSDDEGLFRGCERDCRIISASWGVSRTFEVALKDKQHSSGRMSIFPESIRSAAVMQGDLLSMEGLFQRHYSHQLAKGQPSSQKDERVRVNLTWRYVVGHKHYCPMSKK